MRKVQAIYHTEANNISNLIIMGLVSFVASCRVATVASRVDTGLHLHPSISKHGPE